MKCSLTESVDTLQLLKRAPCELVPRLTAAYTGRSHVAVLLVTLVLSRTTELCSAEPS